MHKMATEHTGNDPRGEIKGNAAICTLVYELFRGSINTAELGWSERQVGDYVTTRKATNPHLLTAVGISKSIGMLFAVSGAD